LKLEQKERPGFDGRWYTDINQGDAAGDKVDKGADNELDEAEKWEQEKKSFWEETTAYTPESRKQVREVYELYTQFLEFLNVKLL